MTIRIFPLFQLRSTTVPTPCGEVRTDPSLQYRPLKSPNHSLLMIQLIFNSLLFTDINQLIRYARKQLSYHYNNQQPNCQQYIRSVIATGNRGTAQRRRKHWFRIPQLIVCSSTAGVNPLLLLTFGQITIVTVAAIDTVLLCILLLQHGLLQTQSARQRLDFATPALLHLLLLLPQHLLVNVLHHQVVFTQILQSLAQFIRLVVNGYLAGLTVLLDIVVDVTNTLLVDLGITRVVGYQTGQTVIPLQHVDLVLQRLNLLVDELSDVGSLPLIVHLHLPILVGGLRKELLLKHLEEQIDFLDDLKFVLHELVVDTLPQSHHVVEDAVVAATELLVDHDVLVTLLLGVRQGVVYVHVERTVVLQEVLLSVLHDAVGTERHQTVGVAAEVGEELVGVVGAEDATVFSRLGHGSLGDA